MENRQDIHVKNIAKYAQVLLSDGLLGVIYRQKYIYSRKKKFSIWVYKINS